MEIAATNNLTVAPKSRRVSHAFSRNLGSLSSLRFNLFGRKFSGRSPSLCMSAASISASSVEKISPESFLDNRESEVLHFVKYHGLGNDFILVDNRDSSEPKITQEQAVKLCDRNFGVGADGVIFAMPGINGTDYTMRIFNSDGSEPEMCGNGVRCFARFIAEIENLQGKHSFTIYTGAGLIIPEIQEDGQVKVDMGEPILKAEEVPTRLPGNKGESVVAGELVVNGVTWNVTCVSMGNPHCITFGTKDSQVRVCFSNDMSIIPPEHNQSNDTKLLHPTPTMSQYKPEKRITRSQSKQLQEAYNTFIDRALAESEEERQEEELTGSNMLGQKLEAGPKDLRDKEWLEERLRHLQAWPQWSQTRNLAILHI